MIPEHHLQLLTAAVDDELSSAESCRLDRLLAVSDEARTMLTQLKHDRARLAAAPQHAIPAGLPERIHAKLAQLPPYSLPVIVPAAAVATRIASRRRPWIPLVVAASVYFVLSAASLYYFVVANRTATKHNESPSVAKADSASHFLPADDQHPSTPILIEPIDNNVPTFKNPQSHTPEVKPTPSVEQNPLPRANPDLHAFPPVRPIAPFNSVRVQIPFLASATDLIREEIREQFCEQLSRDPAYRIDLFARDTTHVVDFLKVAAKAEQVQLFVDATAQDRLKRKQGGSFVVYADSLTPIEVRDLLHHMAIADAKATPHALQMIHATSIVTSDLSDARSVFGTHFDLVPRKQTHLTPPVSVPTAPDAKPISAGTADELAKKLSHTPTSPSRKSAVMMSLTPTRVPPAMSKELTHYREQRGGRRAQTIAVMFVIRPMSN